jgi:hypothetical protein
MPNDGQVEADDARSATERLLAQAADVVRSWDTTARGGGGAAAAPSPSPPPAALRQETNTRRYGTPRHGTVRAAAAAVWARGREGLERPEVGARAGVDAVALRTGRSRYRTAAAASLRRSPYSSSMRPLPDQVEPAHRAHIKCIICDAIAASNDAFAPEPAQAADAAQLVAGAVTRPVRKKSGLPRAVAQGIRRRAEEDDDAHRPRKSGDEACCDVDYVCKRCRGLISAPKVGAGAGAPAARQRMPADRADGSPSKLYPGVCWKKTLEQDASGRWVAGGKWQAILKQDGVPRLLGSFADEFDAGAIGPAAVRSICHHRDDVFAFLWPLLDACAPAC